jgi:cardiolipin synthase A/B
MNAAFWDRKTARALLSELFREHLERDISGMDDIAALRLFRAIAGYNRKLFNVGDPAWQGLAFSLLPLNPS